MRKVDFFIAGVQKGGTTALHRKLRRHPHVELPWKKELHFFDNETVDWKNPPYERLHSYFDFSHNAVFGEATPIYIYWPEAIRRIMEYNSSAKVIVILRHPTFRTLSAWRMEVARNAESFPFGLAVSILGRTRVRWAPGGVHRVYSYLERSCYADQIRRLLQLVPRRQVLFLTSDELWEAEAEVLDRAWMFLGVEPDQALRRGKGQKYIVPIDSRHVPVGSSAVVEYLNWKFRDEIIRTAEIADLDLSRWLDRNYREPMHIS